MKIDWKKLKPIGQRLIVKIDPNENSETRGGIINPHRNRTVATVLKASVDIHHDALRFNSRALLRKLNDARIHQTCIDRENHIHLIDENRVVGIFRGNNLLPIGRKVLVRRLIESEQLPSGIVIPYGIQAKDQTMWCEIVAFGVPNIGQVFKNSMAAVGDRCLIQEWKQEHIEVGNYRGGYYLIVPEDDLCYIEYNTVDSAPIQIEA